MVGLYCPDVSPCTSTLAPFRGAIFIQQAARLIDVVIMMRGVHITSTAHTPPVHRKFNKSLTKVETFLLYQDLRGGSGQGALGLTQGFLTSFHVNPQAGGPYLLLSSPVTSSHA